MVAVGAVQQFFRRPDMPTFCIDTAAAGGCRSVSVISNVMMGTLRQQGQSCSAAGAGCGRMRDTGAAAVPTHKQPINRT